jgi:hypothetical protein
MGSWSIGVEQVVLRRTPRPPADRRLRQLVKELEALGLGEVEEQLS